MLLAQSPRLDKVLRPNQIPSTFQGHEPLQSPQQPIYDPRSITNAITNRRHQAPALDQTREMGAVCAPVLQVLPVDCSLALQRSIYCKMKNKKLVTNEQTINKYTQVIGISIVNVLALFLFLYNAFTTFFVCFNYRLKRRAAAEWKQLPGCLLRRSWNPAESSLSGISSIVSPICSHNLTAASMYLYPRTGVFMQALLHLIGLFEKMERRKGCENKKYYIASIEFIVKANETSAVVWQADNTSGKTQDYEPGIVQQEIKSKDKSSCLTRPFAFLYIFYNQLVKIGWAWWLTPVIPALWEAKVGRLQDIHHHAWLIFILLAETGFSYVGQAGLKLLALCDPPTSASQSSRITGMSH
ncbi:hypothetical protein AAY473_036838 [Plecturocebus cupreus]